MFNLFGINFNLELTNSFYKKTLLKELNIYKNNDSKTNLLITDDWSSFDYELISQNPKQHYFYKNVFFIEDKLSNIAFVFNDERKLKKVYFKINYAKSRSRRIIRKWFNMQFTNRIENVGQIFHENVLIPLSFFYKNLTPIHAAGISINEISYLLGGTGGVGKTTIELEQCFRNKYTFITDDIAVVNNKGEVYLNNNHPKIYGYNLVGNPLLRKKLFKNTTLLNKIHWNLHKKIFGLNKVRRKTSPKDVFQNVLNKKQELNNYFILSKHTISKIEKEKLTKEQAIEMTISILFTEYQYFFNHIYWHEFNALSNNSKPLTSVKEIKEQWTENLTTVFNNVEITLVKIPIDLSHAEFKVLQNNLFE